MHRTRHAIRTYKLGEEGKFCSLDACSVPLSLILDSTHFDILRTLRACASLYLPPPLPHCLLLKLAWLGLISSDALWKTTNVYVPHF